MARRNVIRIVNIWHKRLTETRDEGIRQLYFDKLKRSNDFLTPELKKYIIRVEFDEKTRLQPKVVMVEERNCKKSSGQK